MTRIREEEEEVGRLDRAQILLGLALYIEHLGIFSLHGIMY